MASGLTASTAGTIFGFSTQCAEEAHKFFVANGVAQPAPYFAASEAITPRNNRFILSGIGTKVVELAGRKASANLCIETTPDLFFIRSLLHAGKYTLEAGLLTFNDVYLSGKAPFGSMLIGVESAKAEQTEDRLMGVTYIQLANSLISELNQLGINGAVGRINSAFM